MQSSRRNFLRLSGAGLLATQAPFLLASQQAFKTKVSGHPFELGIASYTFREFSLEETIAMTVRLGVHKLCLKSMHMPLDSTVDEIKSGAAKVNQAGIDLYGGGGQCICLCNLCRNGFDCWGSRACTS
jgi:inosose dehydratase